MKLLQFVFLFVFISLCTAVFGQEQAIMPKREVLSFDKGWKFHLGDVPFPVIKGHNATYTSTKAGRATGAADPAYDDSGWRCVDLPHDWVIEMPLIRMRTSLKAIKTGIRLVSTPVQT